MLKQFFATFIITISAFGASAAPVTINFTGALTGFFDPTLGDFGEFLDSFGGIGKGDTFSGSYTYDPSVAGTPSSTPLPPDFGVAQFNNLLDASLTIVSSSPGGGVVFSATYGPGVDLPYIRQQDTPSTLGGVDIYQMSAGITAASSQIGGFDVTSFVFTLGDPTGTAITDVFNLLNPPSLSSFSSPYRFGIDLNLLNSTGHSGFFRGDLETLSVPEPGSLLLLGAAVVTSRFARRRIKYVNS